MSLKDKIEKYTQDYEAAVAELDRKFQDGQLKAVLDEFGRTSEQLAKRVQLQEGSSAKDIKTHLKRLKDQYKDTPADLKEMLEAPIAQLEQRYENQKLAEAQAREPLHLELVWDDCLILPIRWENRLNNNSPQEHSLTEKLYFGATKAVFDKDSDCSEAEWNGYVSINASLPLMYWSQLHKLIIDEMGPELENANITLSVVGMNNIKTAVPEAIEYAAAETQEQAEESVYETAEQAAATEEPVKEQTVAEETLSEDPLENIVNKYYCKSASYVADSMEITQVAVTNKIQKGRIHGFKYNGHWQIPEHDLATYLFSHERKESGMYSRKPSELNDTELKEYIKEVGMVHNLREASVKMDESQKKVTELLEENSLHGVKHDGKWYIADKEIEFFKEAGKYVYDE